MPKVGSNSDSSTTIKWMAVLRGYQKSWRKWSFMVFTKRGRISDHGLSGRIFGASSFFGSKEVSSWMLKYFWTRQLTGLIGKMMTLSSVATGNTISTNIGMDLWPALNTIRIGLWLFWIL